MQSVGKPRAKRWRDFEEAREFVRSLGLKNQRAWHEYSRSEQKPNDIPTNPQRTYKARWRGWGDWLGTDTVWVGNREYRSFEEAREFVRSLRLTSYKEWMGWRKSGDKPNDIPSNPNLVYKDVGWLGYGDWLGTGKVRRGKEEWRPFEEARAFVRGLGLKNEAQWREYCRSGKKPVDVPANLVGVYGDEWQGMGDFLGTGNIANRHKVFRPFEEAREFVRSLGLKSAEEWREYAKSGNKPPDIPFNPDQVYTGKQKGEITNITENIGVDTEEQGEWRGWADWLGVVSVWSRATLLAFLEDLRPRLKNLEETELYLILQQGGAMPGLQKALGKTTALGVLKDLKENGGRAIEAALEAAADEEIADSYVEDDLSAKEENETLQEHTPEDEELKEDLLQTGGLAALATPEALRLVDDLANLHYGLDDETAQYLVDNRIAGLW
jgi:hypothetical protein